MDNTVWKAWKKNEKSYTILKRDPWFYVSEANQSMKPQVFCVRNLGLSVVIYVEWKH